MTLEFVFSKLEKYKIGRKKNTKKQYKNSKINETYNETVVPFNDLISVVVRVSQQELNLLLFVFYFEKI